MDAIRVSVAFDSNVYGIWGWSWLAQSQLVLVQSTLHRGHGVAPSFPSFLASCQEGTVKDVLFLG